MKTQNKIDQPSITSASSKEKRRYKSRKNIYDGDGCRSKSPPGYIVIEKDSISDSVDYHPDKRKKRKCGSRQKSEDESLSPDNIKQDSMNPRTEERNHRGDDRHRRSNNTNDYGRSRDSRRINENRRKSVYLGENNPYYPDYPHFDYNSWNQAREYFTDYHCPYPRESEFLNDVTPYFHNRQLPHSYENNNTKGRFNCNNGYRNFVDRRNNAFNKPMYHHNGPPHSWGRRPYAYRSPHTRNEQFQEVMSKNRASYSGCRGRGRPIWGRHSEDRRRHRLHTSSVSGQEHFKTEKDHSKQDSSPKKDKQKEN